MEFPLVLVRCQEFDDVWAHVLFDSERHVNASFFLKSGLVTIVEPFDCDVVISILGVQCQWVTAFKWLVGSLPLVTNCFETCSAMDECEW